MLEKSILQRRHNLRTTIRGLLFWLCIINYQDSLSFSSWRRKSRSFMRKPSTVPTYPNIHAVFWHRSIELELPKYNSFLTSQISADILQGWARLIDESLAVVNESLRGCPDVGRRVVVLKPYWQEKSPTLVYYLKQLWQVRIAASTFLGSRRHSPVYNSRDRSLSLLATSQHLLCFHKARIIGNTQLVFCSRAA